MTRIYAPGEDFVAAAQTERVATLERTVAAQTKALLHYVRECPACGGCAVTVGSFFQVVPCVQCRPAREALGMEG